MRNSYKITAKDGVYFLTSTIIEWLPVFTSKIYFEIIIDSLKYCQQKMDLKLYAYVILDNHFHLVVSAANLAKVLSSLRKFTAHQIIEQLKNDDKNWLLNQLAFYKKPGKTESIHQVWQEGMHPQLIKDQAMFNQKVEYIHYNPIKRGLVDESIHWRYSSARNYILNDHSIIQICDISN